MLVLVCKLRGRQHQLDRVGNQVLGDGVNGPFDGCLHHSWGSALRVSGFRRVNLDIHGREEFCLPQGFDTSKLLVHRLLPTKALPLVTRPPWDGGRSPTNAEPPRTVV